MKTRTFGWGLILALLLVGCGGQSTGTEGQLILWTAMSESETATLQRSLERFEEIYPNVRVITNAIPTEATLLARYEAAATMGLGPDLFVGPTSWIRPLAEQRLIADMSDRAPNTEIYFANAVTNVTYDDRLYGLPFAVRPVALYYHTTMVDEPPATLDALLEAASNGQRVAINTRFEASFWGVRAFGGELFDENGRVLLDEGGFANWLSWLRAAQDAPGVVINRDTATLETLFLQQQVAMIVTGPNFMAEVSERYDTGEVAVAPLPEGPNDVAGPFLNTDAFMFNRASAKTELALTLAQFITNNEQSLFFVRDASLVPANRRIRVDTRAFPMVSGFVAQVRNAIAVPNTPQMDLVRELGDDAVTQVLEGVRTETEAANVIALQVNETFGLTPSSAQTLVCVGEGEISVWHSWQNESRRILETIAEAYNDACPNITVRYTNLFADDLLQRYQALAGLNAAPDLILGPHTWTLELASGDYLQPVPNDLLQRYIPTAQETLRHEDAVYGLPVSVELVALYYNTNLVPGDPAATLDALRRAAEDGQRIAIPYGFDVGYWGLTAFGGRFFDDAGTMVIGDDSFTQWLAWLQTTPNLQLDANPVNLQRQFLNAEVAYYVGSVDVLRELEFVMGTDHVRVTTLPEGPAGPALPLLSSNAFMVSARGGNTDMAMAFAAFATTAANQAELLEATGRIPANVNVVLDETSPLTAFTQQATLAVVLPNTPQVEQVRAAGNDAYTAVLGPQAASPAEAVAQFTQAIDE